MTNCWHSNCLFNENIFMKTKSIVAGLVALASALTTYYIIKRRNRKPEPVQKTHHLTEVFARAKTHAK
jgi:hypothetical protein